MYFYACLFIDIYTYKNVFICIDMYLNFVTLIYIFIYEFFLVLRMTMR